MSTPLKTLRLERGRVGRVELAYRHFTDGTQSEEPVGLTVHWAPADTRGEWEQFVAFATVGADFKVQPGEEIFIVANLSGGLVLGVVIRDVVCFNCLGLADRDLQALAANERAENGGFIPWPAT